MSWAARRRFFILLIVGAVVFAFLAILSIAVFTETPTCTDGKQNQDETGIDCGGGCAYLCTADVFPPTVLFTKVLDTGTGQTNVIASIENKNATAAAQNVPYRLTLFGKDQALIQEVKGTIDLPPGREVPLFVPNITSGKQTATRAFLTITESPHWFRLSSDVYRIPRVVSVEQVGTENAPRIDIVLSNPDTAPMRQITLTVLAFSAEGAIVAASKTIVPFINAQAETTATVTWNAPFPVPATTITAVPSVALEGAAP